MRSSVGQFLLETLFPLYCLGCNEEGVALCHTCATTSFGTSFSWYCPTCMIPQNQGGECDGHACALDGVASLTAHHHPLLRQSLHTLKYGYVEQIADAYGEVLARALAEEMMFRDEQWTLVSVPLHRKRMLVRDFNQSERMCRAMTQIASYAGPVLRRTRHTREQAQLSREDRLRNVAGAFEVVGSAPERCILIDDVTTTGATLRECATALKAAGAQQVYGVVMAHG